MRFATGELPFLLTPAALPGRVLAKKFSRKPLTMASNALTPMVATARKIKEDHPDASVVFIGPCASKKLEASRKSVRSDVDFVITFEELAGMFDAKGIELKAWNRRILWRMPPARAAATAWRAVLPARLRPASGNIIPTWEVNIEACGEPGGMPEDADARQGGQEERLPDRGDGLSGGCIAGAGTNIAIPQAMKEVNRL